MRRSAKNDDDTSYKDTIEINVIAPEQVKLAYGQSVSKPMQEYLLQTGYTLSADRNSVTISEDGSLQAVGFRPSVIYAGQWTWQLFCDSRSND